jgi:hypothetical protein
MLSIPPGARQYAAGDHALALELPETTDVDAFLRIALAAGASVLSVSPRRESLEDLFVREAQLASAGTATGAQPPERAAS